MEDNGCARGQSSQPAVQRHRNLGNVGSNSSSSDPEWQSIVQCKLPQLVNSIRVLELLDCLLADNLVNCEEYEKLTNVTRSESQHSAIRNLLVSILPRKPPGSFPRFLRALRSLPEQKFVAELLETTDRSDVRVEDKPVFQCQAAKTAVADGCCDVMTEKEEISKPGEQVVRWCTLEAIAKPLNHPPTAQCKDWRSLAEELGFSKKDIDTFASQTNPAMAMLCDWASTAQDKATLNTTLRQKLHKIGRLDVLQMFDETTGINDHPQLTSANSFRRDSGTSWQSFQQGPYRRFFAKAMKLVRLLYKTPPDDSLISNVCTCITNIQTVSFIFLLVNDILQYFGLHLILFSLMSHICLVVPLCQFWFCEAKVHTMYGLTVEATDCNSRLSSSSTQSDAREIMENKLEQILRQRKLLATELRRAILLTVTIETGLMAVCAYGYWFTKTVLVVAPIFVLLLADYLFNLYLLINFYPTVSSAVKRIEKRFAQLLTRKGPTKRI